MVRCAAMAKRPATHKNAQSIVKLPNGANAVPRVAVVFKHGQWNLNCMVANSVSRMTLLKLATLVLVQSIVNFPNGPSVRNHVVPAFGLELLMCMQTLPENNVQQKNRRT